MAVEDSDFARSRLLRFFEPFVALMSRASGRDLSIRQLLEEQLATGETNIQTFSHNFHMSVLGACGITPRETNQT